VILLFSLFFLLPVFFYKLSAVSLSSWDEAWYGVIARNIYLKGDLLNLSFNGRAFYDHPPFGFWLQDIAYKIFGISDFSVRFPSAILGFLTIIVLYLLGREIFGKSAGFFAAISLATSPWFLFRARSGNLDVPLTFLFVLSFYLCIKASKNFTYLIPLSVSLGFLFLTKTLVPFTIIPALIIILWKKVTLKNLFFPFLLFLIIVLPWFVVNYFNNPDLISRYFAIGYPGNKSGTNIWQNILLTKIYLHNGIGNWFWWGILSFGFGLLLFRKKYFPIIVFIITFLLPFAFSNKGHIWHLIPLHPFWILVFFGLIELTVKKYKYILMFILFMLISWNQIKRNWYEIINVPAYISDINILSTKSKEYNLPLYLDDDAVPEAIFYSGKDRVERIMGRDGIRMTFNSQKEFLLITRDWRLTEEKINAKEYTLIAKDRDKILILNKR